MPDKKLTVAIIDYDMGNLFSVKQACEFVGLNAIISNQEEDLRNADAAILPGVGAFGDAMANLRRLDLVGPIRDFIKSGKFFMGICLGMQLLMSESEEFGSHKGLDILPGGVIGFLPSLSDRENIKVPQVGWNRIYRQGFQNDWDRTILIGLEDGEFMYFVHSFYVVPESKDIILSLSNYHGFEYCSSIFFENIFACQFHPERSAKKGIQIYRNLADKLKKEVNLGEK